MRVKRLGMILFFEVGTVAFERKPKLANEFFHIVADAKALLVGFGGETVGMLVMLSCKW